MKIRNRLIISNSIIITILIVIFLGWYFEDIAEVKKVSMESSIAALNDLGSENYKLSEEILTKYGKKMIKLEAQIVSGKISRMLKGVDLSNYEEIRKNQELRKIATSDTRTADGDKVGYFDMLDMHGEAVLHPNKSIEGKNYSQWKEQFPEMWAIVEKSFSKSPVDGVYDFFDENNVPVKKYMYLIHIDGTPFILVATVTGREYYSKVHDKIRQKVNEAESGVITGLDAEWDKIVMEMVFWGIVGGLVLIILGLGMGYSTASRITKPISELCEMVDRIGDGNFAAKVEFPRKPFDEVASLANNFNRLGDKLTEYVDELKTQISAREAIEAEVMAARRIQNSLLPRNTSVFSGRREFSIDAVLVSAKNVSGDYYDYFLIEENKIAFLVADVSGKGIPASLFMAVVRTVIRNLCPKETIDPAKVLKEANLYLCADNDSCMFVTLFLAYCDLRSGQTVYANAGHNPPFVLDPAGNLRNIGLFKDMPLGVDESASYELGSENIGENESLVIYTDGITEAISPEGELFGESRLEELLKENHALTTREIAEKTVSRVKEYQSDNIFDDITFLIFRRNRCS